MEEIAILRKELVDAQMREKDLVQLNEELTDFLENAAIPLHWVNGSGIIIWANKAELDLLGYSKEEYIGKHISNFHSDQKGIDEILTRLIKKETLQNYPAYLKKKDGSKVPVLITSNVRWEGDNFIHTRCFTRDISDLKKLEQEKVALINELQERNQALQKENEKLKIELKSTPKK